MEQKLPKLDAIADGQSFALAIADPIADSDPVAEPDSAANPGIHLPEGRYHSVE